MDIELASCWQFMDDIISTDSSSSEDDEEIVAETENVAINFISFCDTLTNENFRKHFRMYKETFQHLLGMIEDMICTVGDSGRNAIDAKYQLLFTIWYYATPDSYMSICTRFKIGSATGYRTVHRVTDALIKLAPAVIRWPSGDYLNEVKEEFNNIGFPDVIGCIDGCYIPIPIPKEEGRAYICRKNMACIILQAVCDHKLLFTHCYAGEVGSVHDTKVLKNSEIWTYMHTDADQMFPDNSHLLGDKAYPIFPQLMVPYKDNGHLTRQQKNFNYRLSAARSTIERSFGLLKKRFRELKFLDVRNIEWIPKYILACCVLHNICILQNDIEIYDDFAVEEVHIQQDEYEGNLQEGRLRRQAGTQKRNAIADAL